MYRVWTWEAIYTQAQEELARKANLFSGEEYKKCRVYKILMAIVKR